MHLQTARQLIKQTQANFNTISSHFFHTRSRLWQDILAFVPPITTKTKILDLGCGNGRFCQLAKTPKNYLGVDFSQKLLAAAKKTYPQAHFLYGDLTQKPTWQKIRLHAPFDLIFCIAFLPHLPLPSHHHFILQQTRRLLKPSGHLLLSVWNLWQPRFLLHHLRQLPQKLAYRSPFSLWVPYKLSDGRKTIHTASRYHYAFLPWQPLLLLKKTGFKVVKKQLWGKNLIYLAAPA